ncbi:MAG: protein Tex, partial [Campylobacterota bacterium]|nr:protein Tex [Campylobacterota bacterium]
MTGGADDEVLRDFEAIYVGAKKLLERKEEVSRLIAERATLSDVLKKSIDEAESLRVLEDIYRPYKEKKNSRAATAIENGLTPLANILEKAQLSLEEFKSKAKEFVKGNVTSVDEAVQGAQDILAERYADMPREREAIRSNMLRHGVLEVKKTKNFDENGVFKNFALKSEKV